MNLIFRKFEKTWLMINCFVDDQQKGNWNHRSASRFNVYTPKHHFHFFQHSLKILAPNHIKDLWKIMLKLFHGQEWYLNRSFSRIPFTFKNHPTSQRFCIKPLSNHFIFAYFLFYLLTKMLMFVICFCCSWCCCCYCYYILPRAVLI